MFSGTGNSMLILSGVSGNRKFKMAAPKQEMPISQLVDDIERKCQRLYTHVFGDRELNVTGYNIVRSGVSGSREFKMAAAKLKIRISQFVNTIQTNFVRLNRC